MPANDYTSYDPDGPVAPRFNRIRKLIVSIAGTGGALATWLASSTHSPIEIAAAVAAFVITNYGVYEAKNEPAA